MPTSKIQAGDIAMHYELSGPANAPVVCLHHCFASSMGYWEEHLPALEGFRVLRFDAARPWRDRCTARPIHA